jgi:divalent metal cation (Fe/Co/Zn/Cd) transporter
MSLTKWFLSGVAIVGIVLFLYGANYYDPVVGWVGVGFFAVAVVVFLALYVYGELTKKPVQNP